MEKNKRERNPRMSSEELFQATLFITEQCDVLSRGYLRLRGIAGKATPGQPDEDLTHLLRSVAGYYKFILRETRKIIGAINVVIEHKSTRG